MRSAALAWRHPAHHTSAVGDRLLGVEAALGAGKSLADDSGGLVDEHGHDQAASFTALTIFSAASARLLAERIRKPPPARVSFPFSAFVPSGCPASGTS